MKPCYVFGPWIDRAPNPADPGAVVAVRKAPNPAERAEVWLYTKEDDGTPVSSDVAGWYGCFGAMEDSRRLGGQHLSVNSAKGRLDAMIRNAGHLFVEEIEGVAPRINTAEHLVCVLADAADLVHERLNVIQPYFAIWKNEGEAIEEIRRRLDEAGVCKRTTGQGFWVVNNQQQIVERMERAEKRVAELESEEDATLTPRGRDISRWQKLPESSDLPPITPATFTQVRRATDADTPVGDDRAPDRYMASGRETIDEVRDVCRKIASDCSSVAQSLDAIFAAHCLLTAYVYDSRAGRKGPAEQDHAKARWYLQMAAHVLGLHKNGEPIEDPRAKRPDYQPYVQRDVEIVSTRKGRRDALVMDKDWHGFDARLLLSEISYGLTT